MYNALYLVVVLSTSLIGFIQSAENTNMMIPIKSEEGIKPFMGKFVAYTTETHYFGKDQGFILSDPGIKYGYVEGPAGSNDRPVYDCYDEPMYGFAPTLDKYFILHQLLKDRGDIPHVRHMINDRIEIDSLFFRDITPQEGRSIASALDEKRAKFESLRKEDIRLRKILTMLSHFR